MRKNFVVLSLLLVVVLGLCSGCSGNTNYNGKKITDEETQKKIEEAISSSISSDKYAELTKILDDFKSKGYDLSSYKNNKSFSEFIVLKLSNLDSIDSIIKLLNILEKYQYKDVTVAETIASLYWGEDKSLEDKLLIAKTFDNLEFYGPVEITQDDVDKYIAKNESKITMNKNEGGYYDDFSHKFTTKNRDIRSNGDIITTSAQYFGDFAILNTDREYLDSYYQIHHSYDHQLYFRGCTLSGIDKIESFKYASPYLFSTYDGKTVIFEVDGKYSSSIIYTIN